MARENKSTRAKRGSYRKYNAKERETALRDAEKLGIRAAADKHGMPRSTVENWYKREHGKLPCRTEAPAAAEVASEVEQSAKVPKKPAKRVAKSYTPSLKAEILEHAAANGATAAHRKYAVSRFSIYQWQRQAELAARGKGPSPTSGPDPRDVEVQRDKEILDELYQRGRAGDRVPRFKHRPAFREG